MKNGKVIIAGAGPGDPDLITIKAARYLRAADVIISDRLVSREILKEYASPNARILYVGKEGNSSHSVPQETINNLLVMHYQADKLVVRLKGGDVAFFSNVLDELETLVSNNIPFEIIPGITAASGASAYAGIPLTARSYSRGVRFLTFFKNEEWESSYWLELVSTKDTLVLYMSANQISEFAVQFLKYGALPDKPLAVIEQATTPSQKVYPLSLLDCIEFQSRYVSPSLVIIGEVVKLHKYYKWWKGSDKVSSFRSATQNSNLGTLNNQ